MSSTETGRPLRIAIADPPYPGQSKKHYGDRHDYAGEVDHEELIDRLVNAYDGWALNTSSTALASIIGMLGQCMQPDEYRVMAWVKPFAAFKRNVPVAYAWEPVIVKPARKPVVGRTVVPLRDWCSENITMQRGVSGAKPERVCWWMFEVIGANRGDEFDDLYPGSGAVTQAWHSWQNQMTLDEVSA